MNNWVEEVMMWNEDRDNLNYSPSLEYSMLDEELEEYMEAGITDDIVGQADALIDIIIVATGALYKLLDGNKQKFDDCMLTVTAANNLKPVDKVNGKIVKGDKYIAPEPMIEEILCK